jgi:hypothetical protein
VSAACLFFGTLLFAEVGRASALRDSHATLKA